ncbi:MAG: TetR family transcriptional regulator [Firmicutes bacterium]|nr:TetR family transcriptional regulator [Bacillota bacterium]
MVRVVKEPEERSKEIIDAAQSLFEGIGYDETSINDIIQLAGIAKGTFYYYFKSKEEVLDAVINRGMDSQVQFLMKVIADNSCNALQKLETIICKNLKLCIENAEILEYLHRKENILMHQKTLVQSVKRFAPVLAQIIQQGIDEGIFNTRYPLEVTEYLLVGTNFLFDLSVFPWKKDEYAVRIDALTEILEGTLQARKGSFKFITTQINELYCGSIYGKKLIAIDYTASAEG